MKGEALTSAGHPHGALPLKCNIPRTLPSNPQELTDVQGTLFFTSDDGIHGAELWKSDGTKAGTVLVKDVIPGGGGGGGYYEYGPENLTGVAGTLFFTADDGIHGDELWKSDGTKAGTVLVKDITPGSGYYDYGPENLTDVGGTLFFTADDGTHGTELWKSDGTKAGTVLVKDIDPGGSGSGGYYNGPSNLTDVGGTLFFTADDGNHGEELWTSDGTRAGTALVKNIHVGDYSSYPGSLTDVDGELFFTAADGAHGPELWKSDGTVAGTVLVKDINPGSGGGDYYNYGPTDLIGVAGTLFFTADDDAHGPELWKSDGTKAGTVLVKDINPGRSGSDGGGGGGGYYDEGGSDRTGVRGTLFFSADDGTHGTELWKSDGTKAGTVLVENINPGDYSGLPEYLTGVGGTLFFTAKDGIHGPEVWKSDGTSAGTLLVEDINPCARHRSPSELTDVKGALLFSADDGTHGLELWKSDGSAAGTALVKDINKQDATKGTAAATAHARPAR